MIVKIFQTDDTHTDIKHWLKQQYSDGAYILTPNRTMELDTGRTRHRISIGRVARAIQHTNKS